MTNNDVEWDQDSAVAYVACCYGPEGEDPGDCYTRVGEGEDGQWYVDDGDDTVRCDTYGPFGSREEAERKAADLASELDEAGPGEDAEDALDRIRAERAGEPDPDGEWAVYWETALDDAGPVERYGSEESAEARAAQMQDGLHRSHPGGRLLCGYSVRRLVDGEWQKYAV